MRVFEMADLMRNWQTARKWLWNNVSLSILIGSTLTLITLNLDFHRVEAFFYDLNIRISKSGGLDKRIALLSIDDDDVSMPYATLNSVSSHAIALERLLSQNPAAVVFLNKIDPSDVETNFKDAEKIAQLAQQAKERGIHVIFGTDVDLAGEILPPYPLSDLPHYPAILHKDGIAFGEDKVTRRALLTVMDQVSLHLKLAHLEKSDEEVKQIAEKTRGAYYYSPGEVWHLLIKYPADTALSSKGFLLNSYADFVAGRQVPDLHQKIVLIDSIRSDSLNDFTFTPFSRASYDNPRLFVHASILHTLLGNKGIISAPEWINATLTLALCLLLTYIALLYSPARGITSVVVAGFALFLTSLILFHYSGFWLRSVHPLFAMIFSYYLIVPYRAILEYKMRWEVQQKHDILLEVEEMKGNFLSLMSHDLKTPVARIQGLAELVLKQGNLSGQQEREVREILYSTESLDKYITKILNLTKVESSQIKLNRRSKDINKIIETCTNKLAFQAQSKSIQVDLKLEPLFPLQIDAALIIQVLNNLIDNAIKYSPEGSRIEISSRELTDQNRIEICVKDSGMGMEEHEVQRLFTKFFRGRATIGHQLKGSGLGLYLSKYFIELHNGQIKVESERGKGSVFTITLPMHVADERTYEGVSYV